jgi:hypothetical protein
MDKIGTERTKGAHSAARAFLEPVLLLLVPNATNNVVSTGRPKSPLRHLTA